MDSRDKLEEIMISYEASIAIQKQYLVALKDSNERIHDLEAQLDQEITFCDYLRSRFRGCFSRCFKLHYT